MYRVTLTCAGLSQTEGTSAPVDILEEFSHRRSHRNAKCYFDGTLLRLTAENDFDDSGLALLDEFSDAVHACVNYSGTIHLEIQSVEQFDAPAA